MLWRDMRGRTKGGNHRELQDLDPIGFPHKKEKVIGGNVDLDLLSLFPQKDSRSMGGMEEGGQAFKVNNGGERNPKRSWLKEEEGVFIGGWKSDRWKKLEWDFGHKFGRTKLQAGRFEARPNGIGLQAKVLATFEWFVLAPIICSGTWFGTPPDFLAWSQTVRPERIVNTKTVITFASGLRF
jgi:hypothetical protein